MVLRVLEQLLTKKIAQNRSIIDYTRYDNDYYWWFSDYELFLLMQSIQRTKKIRLPRFHSFRMSTVFFMIEGVMAFGKMILSKVMMSFKRKLRIKEKPVILAVAHQNTWRYTRNYFERKIKKDDSFFMNLYDEVKKDHYPIFTYEISWAPKKKLRLDIERFFYWDKEFVPLDAFYTVHVFIETLRARRAFKRRWEDVERNTRFHEFLKTVCPKNHEELLEVFKFYFLRVYPRIIKYRMMYKRLLREARVKVIVLKNEYGTLERPLVFEAKKQGVPVLALQHGEITPTHKGYVYPKSLKDKILLPEITAVQGEYYRDILIDASVYSPVHVRVTGSPRYDIIPLLDQLYSVTNTRARYGIHQEQKLVLWTTQTHGLREHENEQNVQAMLNAMLLLENCILVIKQHPGETREHFEFYEKRFSIIKDRVRILDGTKDTFELMYASDLVITKHSTTGLEAIAIGKPVLVMNLSGEPDLVNYVKEGVAFGAYSAQEVITGITKLLYDKTRDETVRQKYLQKYLYRLDGKATFRVLQLIKKLKAL